MTQTHFISRDTGQTSFSKDAEPVLTIAPGTGARISFETDDLAYQQMHEHHDIEKVTAKLNAVTGPVFIEGAEPGDVLAVTVHDITFPGGGWSVYLPGAGALAGVMGEDWMTRPIDIVDGEAVLTDGLRCPIQPMIGCIGVAPAEGEMSVVMPSYPTGGNMDLTDAAPGSTVYLPVQVPGALLSIGDLHAVMARGESTFVAIEAAGVATVSVDVIKPEEGSSWKGMRAARVETPEEFVFVGIGDPVQTSIQHAYEDLFKYLTLDKGFSNDDAYVVMSAVAHTELGGPTGSKPDPVHPFRAHGAVTLARIEKKYL